MMMMIILCKRIPVKLSIEYAFLLTCLPGMDWLEDWIADCDGNVSLTCQLSSWIVCGCWLCYAMHACFGSS